MKKIKLLIPFLLLMLSASNQAKAMRAPEAKDIPIYKKGSHLGTRTVEPIVTASLDKNQLVINIVRFVGNADIVIIDETGSVAMNSTFAVDGERKDSLDLSELPTGFYSIEIVFDRTIYYGEIDI